MRPPLPRSSLPLPRRLFVLPKFKVYHDRLVTAADLGSMNAPARLVAFKEIFREAALPARDGELIGEHLSDTALPDICVATSRAVSSNNVAFARTLAGRSKLAASLSRTSPLKVSLADLFRFQDTYARYRARAAEHSISRLEKKECDAHRAKRRRRRAMKGGLERMKRLWSPLNRTLCARRSRCWRARCSRPRRCPR